MPQQIIVYTDGSYWQNRNAGGFASLLQREGYYYHLILGGDINTTAAKMELSAIVIGLEVLPPGQDVILMSDHRNLVNLLNTRFMKWLNSGSIPENVQYRKSYCRLLESVYNFNSFTVKLAANKEGLNLYVHKAANSVVRQTYKHWKTFWWREVRRMRSEDLLVIACLKHGVKYRK